FALYSRLSIIVGDDGCLECLVIFGIFHCANDRLGCEPMTERVAARDLLASFGSGSRTLERIAPIGLDLPIRGHWELASKLASLSNFGGVCPITLGSGCEFSHSTRAAAVASMPIVFHQAYSSPQRCTSRWCPRHSGTVNSSLTLRPRARDCAKRRWWASAGRRPQIRHGCLATDLTCSRSRMRRGDDRVSRVLSIRANGCGFRRRLRACGISPSIKSCSARGISFASFA